LARSQLVDQAIDFESGDRMKRGRGFIEHFRVGPNGQVDDTQYAVLHLSASTAVRQANVPPKQSSPKSDVRSARHEHPVHNTKHEHPVIPSRTWGVAQGDTNWSRGWQQPVSFGPFLRW